jgi:hypothetical protein
MMIMEHFKSLFYSLKFPRARERISSKCINNLNMRQPCPRPLNPNLSFPHCNRRINKFVKFLTPTVSKPTEGRQASTTSHLPVGFSKAWIHSLARCNRHDLNISLSRDLTKYAFEISLIYTTTVAWITKGLKQNAHIRNCQTIGTTGKAVSVFGKRTVRTMSWQGLTS